jgi:hypothetical protein
MTQNGCPESSRHGWQEGHLSITWETSQSAHVLTRDENLYEDYINVTYDRFLTPDSKLFVLSTPDELKLSFCYKNRRNISVDTGSWPNWSFSIYRAENMCPQG